MKYGTKEYQLAVMAAKVFNISVGDAARMVKGIRLTVGRALA